MKHAQTRFAPQTPTELSHSNTLLFFAPIAQWPLSHGGSIRSMQLFTELCHVFEMDGLLIGTNFDCTIICNKCTITKHESHEKSKSSAAISSLIHADHYLKQKQLNEDICERFESAIHQVKPATVFMSYLYSSLIVDKVPANIPIFLDTHNNDYEWFENFKNSTGNPLISKICDYSLAKTDTYLNSLESHVSLLHVTKKDADAYRSHRQDLRHFVVPNGCELKPRLIKPKYKVSTVRLLFVGSLSSQMNVDALRHLSEHYWDKLKADASLTVLGSKPSKEVVRLCNDNGWKLLADADDETLTQAYDNTHFAILPFPYGAGSKLKLAEACGRGVPILSTDAGASGMTDLPEGILVSGDPYQWYKHINEFDLTEEYETGLINYGKANSWHQIAENFCHDLVEQELEIPKNLPILQNKHILIHDFGGYPFILEASRQLARLGYTVEHHFVSITQTERDSLERYDQSEPSLRVFRHALSEDYNDIKYQFTKRFNREYNYGKYIADVISNTKSEVIISANAPSHIQSQIQHASEKLGATFIPWIQDFYSKVVAAHFAEKMPIVGSFMGKLYMEWEREILRISSNVAVISDAFNQHLIEWGIDQSKLHTIHNWANISDIPVLPKQNPWAKAHNLHDKFCFVYSGTMGLKHNPDTLIELAKSFSNDKDVMIIVVGEGVGIDYLKKQNLPNMQCLPFQPAKQFPEVLATADVLTALLEPSAGLFSVPSKVLSYLCSERAILLSVPLNNLAALTIVEAGAGKVVAPEDLPGYLAAARALYENSELRGQYGKTGRLYAELHFDPEQIGKNFDAMIRSVA